MKRKRQNFYKYSFKHVQERALEIYGLSLTRENYDQLINMVRWELVRRCFSDSFKKFRKVDQKGSQYMFIVPFMDIDTLVVFNANRALVTTLLPPADFIEHFLD